MAPLFNLDSVFSQSSSSIALIIDYSISLLRETGDHSPPLALPLPLVFFLSSILSLAFAVPSGYKNNMKKEKQFTFGSYVDEFKDYWKESGRRVHGGEHAKGKRKTARPFSSMKPIHVVILDCTFPARQFRDEI
jgi:hypothetical protein